MKDVYARRKRWESVSRGLLLIGIGVILLLLNYDLLSQRFWTLLFTLWPLILILLGIGLLWRDRVPFSLIVLIFLALLAVFSLFADDSRLPGRNVQLFFHDATPSGSGLHSMLPGVGGVLSPE